MPASQGGATDRTTSLANLRIGILHNPRSGANQAAGAPLRRLFEAHSDIPYRDASDPASIVQALGEMAEHGVNTVAISGGDGTVNAVLDIVFGRNPFPVRPLLAVLRGGTSNMTARDIGMPRSQERAVRALIAGAANGGDGLAVVERRVMRIDGAGREPVHGMFFGAAAIAQGIEYCKRELHTRGLRGQIGPALTLARFAMAMARGDRAIVTPVPITVAIDGEPASSFECGIVFVTTLERLLLRLRPYWGAEAAPLHFTSIRAAPRRWLRALPDVLRGRPSRHVTAANGYESRNVRRLLIGLGGKCFVDGETVSPVPGTPLAFADGGAARFIVPR